MNTLQRYSVEDCSKLESIIQLTSDFNTIQDLDILLEKILSESKRILKADAASIQIRETDRLVFTHIQTDSLQRKTAGFHSVFIDHDLAIDDMSIAGYTAKTGKLLNISDVYSLPPDSPYRFNSFYDEKSNYHTGPMLSIPLRTSEGEIIGVMQIINPVDPSAGIEFTGKEVEALRVFNEEDEIMAAHFADIASILLQRAQMTRALILRMINMAELRDPHETGEHANRVASYAVVMYEKWAETRLVPRKELESNRDILRMAAMLHDVGKVAISDTILKKPSALTETERTVMKTHTIHGAKLFSRSFSPFDRMSAEIALRHHENWDGSGYPGHINFAAAWPAREDESSCAEGMKGEEIPIYARIVALADVYDALMSKRAYKESWEVRRVCDEIKSLSGTKFDPELVDLFLSIKQEFESIRHRYPDTGDNS